MAIKPRVRTRSDPPTFHAERLLGSKTGLVNAVEFEPNPREFSETTIATVETTDIDRLLPETADRPNGFNAIGNGTTTEETLLTAIGEFAERYCLHWVPDEDTSESLSGTYAALDDEGVPLVDLAHLTRYEADQLAGLPTKPFDAHAETRWIRGQRLDGDGPIAVPLDLVYLRRVADDGYFFPSSNGSACGGTLEAATLRATYELIERDAVLRSWFTGRSPRRLDLSAFPELERRRARIETEQSSIRLLAFDSPIDSVSVVGATYLDSRDRIPKFLCTAAADLRFESAAESALLELEQGLTYLYSMLASMDRSELVGQFEGDDREMTIGDNVLYYLLPDHADELSMLFDGETSTPEPTDPDASRDDRAELDRLVTELQRAGTTPIAFDVTTRDVAQTGLSVVRTVVPELLPLCRPAVPPRRHPVLSEIEPVDRCHPIG